MFFSVPFVIKAPVALRTAMAMCFWKFCTVGVKMQRVREQDVK